MNKFFLSTLVSIVAACIVSIPVRAEEISANDRLNALEIRLEEMGYAINDMQTAIEAVQTSELTQEEQRLAISDKLDLVVIGLNNLIDNSLAVLDLQNTQDVATSEHRQKVMESLAGNTQAIEALGQDTVSGNALLNDSLIDTKETVIKTQEESNNLFSEYQTYLLIFAGIIIGCIIANIFSRYFHGR